MNRGTKIVGGLTSATLLAGLGGVGGYELRVRNDNQPSAVREYGHATPDLLEASRRYYGTLEALVKATAARRDAQHSTVKGPGHEICKTATVTATGPSATAARLAATACNGVNGDRRLTFSIETTAANLSMTDRKEAGSITKGKEPTSFSFVFSGFRNIAGHNNSAEQSTLVAAPDKTQQTNVDTTAAPVLAADQQALTTMLHIGSDTLWKITNEMKGPNHLKLPLGYETGRPQVQPGQEQLFEFNPF